MTSSLVGSEMCIRDSLWAINGITQKCLESRPHGPMTPRWGPTMDNCSHGLPVTTKSMPGRGVVHNLLQYP
eukprot:4492100-Prorocentrum_lima.AAC.1